MTPAIPTIMMKTTVRTFIALMTVLILAIILTPRIMMTESKTGMKPNHKVFDEHTHVS